MRIRVNSAFSEKLVLFWLIPLLLASWVVAIPAMADMSSTSAIANDGTFYWVQGNDNLTGRLRVTTVALGASNSGSVLGVAPASQGATLTASGTVSPASALFLTTNAKRSSVLNGCDLTVASFNPAGSGSLTVNGATINGYSDGALTLLSTLGYQTGTAQYGIGTSSPTTSIANGTATATVPDGFTLNSGQCVVYVINSSTLAGPGLTINAAGAGGGFLDNLGTTFTSSSGKNDNKGVSFPTTTTTTTTTTVTTTVPRVPTVGNWGMMILALAFLGGMAWMLKARRVHLQ